MAALSSRTHATPASTASSGTSTDGASLAKRTSMDRFNARARSWFPFASPRSVEPGSQFLVACA
jgi:hypothetical protein